MITTPSEMGCSLGDSYVKERVKQRRRMNRYSQPMSSVDPPAGFPPSMWQFCQDCFHLAGRHSSGWPETSLGSTELGRDASVPIRPFGVNAERSRKVFRAELNLRTNSCVLHFIGGAYACALPQQLLVPELRTLSQWRRCNEPPQHGFSRTGKAHLPNPGPLAFSLSSLYYLASVCCMA